MPPKNARRFESRPPTLTLGAGVYRAEPAALEGPIAAPVVAWLTGLSGAGKSTLAAELWRRLHALRRPCLVLDGDEVRCGLSQDLGFLPAGRAENIRRVAHVARLALSSGITVLVAMISPRAADRWLARLIVGPAMLEVFLDASLEVCEARDQKGLYREARAGRILDFTGISAPYDRPDMPDITLDTGALSVEEAAEQVMKRIA